MMEDNEPTRDLISTWQAGQNREEIFRRLFERYAPWVGWFFRRRGFSAEECRDLIQETFLNVYRGIAEFRRESSFETWLRHIVGNLWSNFVRDRAALKRAGTEVPLSVLQEVEDPAEVEFDGSTTRANSGPLSGVLVGENLRLLRGAVIQLPQLQRQLVLLRFSRELKYREIAELLQIPEGTVKSQLSKARESLRLLVGEHYSGDLAD